MTKKVKKEESDEESVPKKGKKKKKKLTPEEAAYEEYLSRFSSLHNVSIDQLPSKLGRFVVSNFKPETYILSLDSGAKIEVTHSKIHEILELKQILVNDIASKLVVAQEIDFLFKVNFLTLFTNTMGKVAGLKGQICLDIVRRLCEDSVISYIDWCGYIYDCLQGSKLPEGTNHYLGPLTFLIIFMVNGPKLRCEMLKVLLVLQKISEKEDFFKKAEEKLSLIYAERVMLEEYIRKASLEYPGDGKFLALHEKYVNLFKDPISFNDDGNGDNGGDDDDGNGDNDGDDDANDGDGNGDEEDANEGDKDPNGSNPSFGFTKISLDDFGNDSGPTEKESVDQTEQGTVVEGNLAEECEIMSTPENYTQWLKRNADLVGETIDSITAEYLYGDLFGDNLVTMEVMNQGLPTPERMLTSVSNVSPSPEKRIVNPSCYLLSPYMNKKTKVVPKIKRLEFILGNSLFAMEGDKIENVFEAHCGKFIVFGIRLNLETLAPGLWLDANVINCWGAVLNHEESFRAAESKSRHFFPTGCITPPLSSLVYSCFEKSQVLSYELLRL
ncbi:hypothetical protein Tco_0605688 [Tanacetum coccineum]